MNLHLLKERIMFILSVLFWIPIWIFAGAWCSLIGGLKDAIDGNIYNRKGENIV